MKTHPSVKSRSRAMTNLKETTFGELNLQGSKRSLLAVPPETSIAAALTTMAANNLLSLAVLSHVQQPGKPPKVAAIITTFDILTYIVSTAKDSKSFDPNAIDLNASIDLVMSLDDSVETYRIWECDYRDTLERTMAAFAKQTHRALITDALEKNAPYILGQTDIIKFANNHRELLTSIVDINRPIKDLGLVHPDKKLIAMSETDTAFDGYKIMSKTNVPALPILNSNGSIVGNLSSSDLRGITPEKLTNLTLPVLDYLKSLQASIQAPITCSPDESLVSVMEKLVSNHVHRLWSVNEQGKVVGIVSQSDIMSVFSQ